jgi:hypothetical protein
MRNANKLIINPEQEAVTEVVPRTGELGQTAVLLGLVEGQQYDGDGSVDQLPVGEHTFSAYGNRYDSGNGSEG